VNEYIDFVIPVRDGRYRTSPTNSTPRCLVLVAAHIKIYDSGSPCYRGVLHNKAWLEFEFSGGTDFESDDLFEVISRLLLAVQTGG